jgi:acyl-CoA thioesterase FadM
MAPETYEYTFTVRLHDIDGAGIVFFARILERAHDAYEALLDALGHSIAGYIVEGKYIIPIGSVEADYKRPLRQGEVIRARVSLMEMTGSSYRVRIRLVGPQSNGSQSYGPRSDGSRSDGPGGDGSAGGPPREDLRAEIRLRCVAVLRATMRPTAVPPDLRQALATFLESPPA